MGFWRGLHSAYIPPPPALPVTAFDTIHGAIEVGDLLRPGGVLADEYTINLPQGRTVSFLAWPEMSDGTRTGTAQLSMSLWRDGILVAIDEAAAGSGEREILFTPKRAATYTLEITSTTSEPVLSSYTLQTAIQDSKPYRPFER